MGAVALATTTLTLREIIIKIAVPLIKHTSFIDFGESGKNTDRFFLSIYERGGLSAFFRSDGKKELWRQLLKLWYKK